jgi:hypothetical protein
LEYLTQLDLRIGIILYFASIGNWLSSATGIASSSLLFSGYLSSGAAGRRAIFRPHPDGWVGYWKPGIGDPSIIGWITVAAYIIAAWYCYRVVRNRRSFRADRESRVWTSLSIGLLLLGINKQLDLQTAITEAGRLLAHGQGWYDRRSLVQMTFLFLLFVLGAAGMAAVIRFTRDTSRYAQSAALGAALLIGFVIMRATSFHYVDRMLRQELAGMRFNWIFELGGILIIFVSAYLRGGERNHD